MTADAKIFYQWFFELVLRIGQIQIPGTGMTFLQFFFALVLIPSILWFFAKPTGNTGGKDDD